jgi:hypothetical protein
MLNITNAEGIAVQLTTALSAKRTLRRTEGAQANPNLFSVIVKTLRTSITSNTLRFSGYLKN